MAVKKLFEQTLVTDGSGYRIALGKATTDDDVNILYSNLQVDWSNITNKPTTFTPTSHTHTLSEITDAPDYLSVNYYPSTGTYRNYKDVIKRSYCKEKELLIPLTDADYEKATFPGYITVSSGDLIVGGTYRVTGTGAIVHDSTTYNTGDTFTAAATTFSVDSGTPVVKTVAKEFTTSGLQIGEWYRVNGTGAILHNNITYDVGEEFRADVTTYSVDSGSPIVTLGTQHAEFEDCSQIYNPQVIEVGDYYYMYYAGNTQKYQNVGMKIAPSGSVDDVVDIFPGTATTDTIQNNADYSRRDQVFLAYKRKETGLYNGEWIKYKNGRTPVLAASGEHSGEDDASNAWFRAVFYDGTQYVMMYAGDSKTDGSDHDANQMWATSTDGISWTKQGTFTTPSGLSLGTMFYHNSAYYLLVYDSTPKLYKSTGDPTNAGTFAGSFSLIDSDLIPDMSIPYSSFTANNKIYITGRKSAAGAQKIYVWECSTTSTNLETPSNWSETGLLYETPIATKDFTDEGYAEYYTGASPYTTDTTANYNCVVPVDITDGNWVVFYSCYNHKFARFPFVPETSIRVLTFSNTNPIPSS